MLDELGRAVTGRNPVGWTGPSGPNEPNWTGHWWTGPLPLDWAAARGGCWAAGSGPGHVGLLGRAYLFNRDLDPIRKKKQKMEKKERGGRAEGESESGDDVGVGDESRARRGRESRGVERWELRAQLGSWVVGAEGVRVKPPAGICTETS
ncbi:hypothetical protein CRG98_042364 [Punica granatum]|uniref:Uncharacterized protein n=1 Tax=Punica granatum TaxID=22663 RepID=A0A2I0HZU7_PUNGR|nr:hypothetical protein CRG98_042364 [Punica granatum]